MHLPIKLAAKKEMFAVHLRTQPLQTGQHKSAFSLKSIFFLTFRWKHKSSVSKYCVQNFKKRHWTRIGWRTRQLCELTKIQDTIKDNESQSLSTLPTPERTHRRFLKRSIKCPNSHEGGFGDFPGRALVCLEGRLLFPTDWLSDS